MKIWSLTIVYLSCGWLKLTFGFCLLLSISWNCSTLVRQLFIATMMFIHIPNGGKNNQPTNQSTHAHTRLQIQTNEQTYFVFGFSSFWIRHTDQPQVTLQLGSTLNPDDIKEGDDVYFECHIKANPKENRITWWHDVSIHKLSQNNIIE